MGKSITVARLGYPRFESINEADYSNSNYIADIANGLMINFKFTYEWTDINTCQITHIVWRPCKFNNNGTLDIDGSNNNVIEFSTNGGFKQKKLKVQFSDTQVTTNNNELFNLDVIPNEVYNQTITLSNISAKYIPVIFKYEHTNENGRTYTLEIPNIKIPKPSRYEENVVFNKDGLNEMIDYFKKYPVIDAIPSPDFGKIRITMGTGNTKDIAIHGCEDSTNTQFKINTNLLPSETKSFYLGNNSWIWKGIYAETLGDSNTPIKNIYATNGDFSENITGNLTGGSIKIGGTASNPKFQVNSDGDVIMNGSITWGNGNPLKQIYHRGVTDGTNQHAQPALPSQSQSYDSMTSDGTSWHKICHSTDYWMTFSTDGGKTWQTPTRINAQDGKDGEPGKWKPETIIEALHLINGDGIFEFDDPVAGSNEIQKLLGIKATAVLAALIEANKININGGTSYNPTDATKFKGGYITFRVPTPWTSRHALNASGFSARLGYLRGNGNGQKATAGIGIAIQTQATYNQAFPDSKKTGGDKLHLLISSLMLTDSGLGLTLAANTANYTTQNNSNWFTTDYGFVGKYHYTYKYVNGNTSRLTWINGDASLGYNAGERGYRLWLHEDNGGLYWLDPDNGFKPWQWEI